MKRKPTFSTFDPFPGDPDEVIDPDAPVRPSKSQMKREMHALQDIGVELVGLPRDALKRLPMPDKLADAVRDARRITDHEGRRRQLQYVGRVMRGLLEPEVAALKKGLDALQGSDRDETARFHRLEQWRARLLSEDVALTEFLKAFPAADAQRGHLLIRLARKELATSRPPRYFRELFQWVKEAGASGADEALAPPTDVNEDEDDT
ncbi:MAG: ribosome biogenesis factor YjgA [Janthinobacterium lividum]